MDDTQVIDNVKALLNEPLNADDDFKDNYRYLYAIEALREPLLSLRCKLQRELLEKREQYRMPNYPPDPKDKTTPRYTDFDRKTMLDAQTAELNEKYELVAGLEKLVEQRVELIKILLEK